MKLPPERPVLVAIAGPNGAGKTTFYHSHIRPAGIRLVNADVLAQRLPVDPYRAARLADAVRRQLVTQRESFAFETVFSDPAGEKVAFLRQAADSGYLVVVCFIGIANWATSEQRVSMRVSKGGHDVPTEKLIARFPRTLDNLRRAVRELPQVRVFDNQDLRRPYRLVAVFEDGEMVRRHGRMPAWLGEVLQSRN